MKVTGRLARLGLVLASMVVSCSDDSDSQTKAENKAWNCGRVENVDACGCWWQDPSIKRAMAVDECTADGPGVHCCVTDAGVEYPHCGCSKEPGCPNSEHESTTCSDGPAPP